MARTAKKLTRKEIRQPDRFVTLTRQLIDLSKNNRTAVILAVVTSLVVVVGFVGWQKYRADKNRLAARQYAHAVRLYHEAQYSNALEALEKMLLTASRPYRSYAMLYQANTHFAFGEPAKGIPVLEMLLQNEAKHPLLRQIALVNLGYAQESLGNCKEASRNFAEAAKLSGPFKEEALLGDARCKASIGESKEALDAYRRYEAEYPGSARANEINTKIQELEGRAQHAK